MTLKLKIYGDPVLRQKAVAVEEITDEIRALAKEMVEVMLKHDGCGLAAPQVGVLLRLFVSNVGEEDEKGVVHYTEPKVYINPIISHPSAIIVERNEGCLSLPGIYAAVPRPLNATIEFTDIEGIRVTKQIHRFLARHVMHENDHLNGVLYIDRLSPKKRAELEPYLRKMKTKK